MHHQTSPIRTNCANCGTTLAGKHCHECGQKAGVHRLTLHELFHEVWHVFTHTDKGILRLIKDMFTHPVSVYEGYFGGQRKKYFSPVLFFLVTAGILAYLYPHVFDYEDRVTNMHNEFGRAMYHMVKYRALILLPVEALLLWLVFHKRFNLAEVMVFMLFCLGFTYTICIVAMPVYFLLITHKAFIDNTLIIVTYLIILLHGSLVLARKQPAYLLAMVLLVNAFYLMDGFLQLYLLFDDKMLDNQNIHGLDDAIKLMYTFY
ncbi:DUF3667 domain-containing protein [Mucilaginibacter sp. ZB1P21]|uniref:DUF3667 domain-containing protein n=1 Tax=Mucilaginibacter glaciei TaxID=2772109 RepID=A0A926S3E4_9SPHI|nr:DUF3667 domain-containing protein [Mucilaginibacter glaciei]MBD1394149.1 DUF3667 domain-containing protein [Mucilaginibacter glaciei]